MKKNIILCLFLLTLYAYAFCGQASRIELTDGSVISGEIVSYLNGVYLIKTTSFGEVKIKADKIAKIDPASYQATGAPAGNSAKPAGDLTQSGVDAYGKKLMSNPENAALITGLAADSQLQEIANDPQIQAAAKSGDIQALMKNEKFMDIVNNPKMQEAIKKIKQ
ncbi:MAG: hypothetical protein WC574_05625 [Candidatus Omnitrophota bacterium]